MTLVSEPPVAAPLAGVACELDDDELIRRARAGDEGAFNALADRHHGWLVARCRRYLGGDHHLAEDVAQECLLKAHDMLLRDDRPLRFRSWVGVVARNACIDELRRRRPQPMGDFDETVRGTIDPVEPGVDPSLATAWRSLNRRYQEVLFHRELTGLSYQEISGAMGTSVAAVETLLFRARAALRREYERAGGQLAGSDLGVVLAAVAADPDRLAALVGADGPAVSVVERLADAVATLPARAGHLAERLHPVASSGAEPWSLGAAAASLALIGSLSLGLGSAAAGDVVKVTVPEVAAPAVSAPSPGELPPLPAPGVPPVDPAAEAEPEPEVEVDAGAPPSTEAAEEERQGLLRRLQERSEARREARSDGPIRSLVGYLQRAGDEAGTEQAAVDDDAATASGDDADRAGPIRALLDRLRR